MPPDRRPTATDADAAALQRLRRVEAELRLSEQRFRAIMEQSPLSTQILAPSGRTIAVNRAWESLWGATLAELAGYNMLQDPQLEERGIAPLLRRAFDGTPVRLPMVPYDPEQTLPGSSRHADSLRWVSAFAYPVMDAEGRVREVVLVHEDVTDTRRAEDRLRGSEERLRMALTAGRMNVWDWDLSSDVVECSEGARAFWGRDVGHVTDFNDAVHEDDLPALEEAVRSAIVNGTDYIIDYRLRLPDGTLRWAQSRGRVERDPQGNARRVIGVTLDITERKHAEQGTRLLAEAGEALGASLDYHATLNHLAEVVVPALADWYAVDLLTEEGTLERVAVTHSDPTRTALAHALLQRYPPRQGLRLGAWQVFETGQPQWAEDVDERLLEEAAQDEEHLRILRGLGLRSYIRVPLIARNSAIGVLTLVHAESGRRYRQADVDLATELARRAAAAVDNARLYERLQREDRRKDEFLAVLAHELRNPLAPIRNGLAVLQADPDPEMAERTRQIMQRQLGHMVRLIDDLLDLSRITRDTIELRTRRIDLASVVASAVEASRPLVTAAQLTLSVELPEAPVLVDGDDTRLGQVLSNLLNNAARFTPSGGRIDLRVREDAAQVLIEVHDTGIGIPAAMRAAIFDMFVRASDSEERAPGGLGIGLTLARRLAELHGGSLRVHSEGPGRGSCFTLRLPRAQAAPQAASSAAGGEPQAASSAAGGEPQAASLAAGGKPPAVARAAAASAPRRVLVVDDNADAARTLETLLSLAGHEVRVAGSGTEALQLVRGFVPDLALLDIGMPGMSGHELARRLRADPALGGTLLVALTGWGREQDRERSVAAGFDDHLTKPVDAEAMLALVERAPLREGTRR